jgi:hypothetical protein
LNSYPSNPKEDQAEDLEEWREDEVVECSGQGEEQTYKPENSSRLIHDLLRLPV